MIEIDAKTKLKSSEGANFFFTLITLVATGVIQRQYIETETCDVNLALFVQMLFFTQVIKITYSLITLVPRYKNQDIVLFFKVLDLVYYLALLGLFIYANVLYFSEGFSACATTAPILTYFTEFFVLIGYILVSVVVLIGLAYLIQIASHSSHD